MIIKTKVDIKEVDKGYEALVLELGNLNGSYVKVGLQEGAESDDGEDLVARGYQNELGTETIPSRPFMRQAFDKYNAALTGAINKQLSFVYAGTKSKSKALEEIGSWYAAKVQYNIRHGEYEPNAASTKAMKLKKTPTKKRAAAIIKPLIDTNQMLGAITYVVVDK